MIGRSGSPKVFWPTRIERCDGNVIPVHRLNRSVTHSQPIFGDRAMATWNSTASALRACMQQCSLLQHLQRRRLRSVSRWLMVGLLACFALATTVPSAEAKPADPYAQPSNDYGDGGPAIREGDPAFDYEAWQKFLEELMRMVQSMWFVWTGLDLPLDQTVDQSDPPADGPEEEQPPPPEDPPTEPEKDAEGGPPVVPGDCGRWQEKSEEQQPGEIGASLSDPVALSTGDYQLVQTDLKVEGRGELDFVFTRTYRARSGIYSIFGSLGTDFEVDTGRLLSQPLGANWDHNYNLRIKSRVDSFGIPEGADLFAGNGRCDFLPIYRADPGNDPDPGAPYVEPSFAMRILPGTTQDPDWRWFTADQIEYRFHAPIISGSTLEEGMLKEVRDRHGNSIRIEYEGFLSNVLFSGAGPQLRPRIQKITDTLGREYLFYYQDNASSSFSQLNPTPAPESVGHLIWKIHDVTGNREIVYEYEEPRFIVSSNGTHFKDNLVRVKLPEVPAVATGSGEQNAYVGTNRPTWKFEYYPIVFPDDEIWEGQIRKVWNPRGELVVENTYYPGTAAFSRSDARLRSQTYGSGQYIYML